MTLDELVDKLKVGKQLAAKAKRRALKHRTAALKVQKFSWKAITTFVRSNNKLLQQIRQGSGITQKELAEAADVPIPYISMLENGDISKLSFDSLFNILNVYVEL